jgi:hypothetical protein
MIKEITAQKLNTENFIDEKVKESGAKHLLQQDYPRCAKHRQCHVQHSTETPFNDRSGLTIMKASAA